MLYVATAVVHYNAKCLKQPKLAKSKRKTHST